MPYLIDGHNLIPKVAGLSLGDIDDEVQLIEQLQEFCRLQRKQVEIHFDNAPAGQPRARVYGPVTARFTRAGKSADQSIQEHLTRLGKAARNWTVVSSDRSVQVSARAARAQVMSSEAFAALLRRALEGGPASAEQSPDADLPPDELQDWLDLFGGKDQG
jgi:predicted RNA-binding protein with PIN domain